MSQNIEYCFVWASIGTKCWSFSSISVEHVLSLYSLRLKSRFACLCVDQINFLRFYRRRSVFACPAHHKNTSNFNTRNVIWPTKSWEHRQVYRDLNFKKLKNKESIFLAVKLPSSNWWTNTNPHGTDARLLIHPTKIYRKIKRRGKQQNSLWQCERSVELSSKWLLTVEALAESPLLHVMIARLSHRCSRCSKHVFVPNFMAREIEKDFVSVGPRCDYEILSFHVFLLFFFGLFCGREGKKLRFSSAQLKIRQ